MASDIIELWKASALRQLCLPLLPFTHARSKSIVSNSCQNISETKHRDSYGLFISINVATTITQGLIIGWLSINIDVDHVQPHDSEGNYIECYDWSAAS